MAAEYRIFEDTTLGTGAAAVKATSLDTDHGDINYDNPMIIEYPGEPSLRWECLNDEAEEAMEDLIAKKNKDEQVWIDGRGKKHNDTGTNQRARLYRKPRVGTEEFKPEDQGFTVKKQKKKAKKPVQAAMSESHQGLGTTKQAI